MQDITEVDWEGDGLQKQGMIHRSSSTDSIPWPKLQKTKFPEKVVK